MTGAAQRGVDHDASRLTGEELDDLTLEHGYVKTVRGHPQPFNRRRRARGRRRIPSRLDDCQAARGPRPVLLLKVVH